MNAFDLLLKVRDYGLEVALGRYYAKYAATVEDAADPQGQGRVRVSSRVATGRTNPIAKWAYPSADYGGQDKGIFFPPDEGDLVWVWFDQGKTSEPRYSGAWWGSRAKDEKKPDDSHVPAEFRPGDTAPTKRGIKTKGGLGLLFDDTEDEVKIELWTGEQKEAGAAAERKHLFQLDNTNESEQIVILSESGHASRWVDIAGEERIEHITAKEHEIIISDKDDKITLKCKDGFELVIDQKNQKITAATAAGQKIEMLDSGTKINIEDSTGNKVTLSPTGVDVTSEVALNVTAKAAATIQAQGAATVDAGGALTLTGASLALSSKSGTTSQTSAGAATGTFTGIKTDTYSGGLFQNVTGLFSTVATSVILAGQAAGAVLVGSVAGAKFKLVDERALTWLEAHTHTAIGLGAPTSKPIEPIIAEVLTTSYLKAD